MPQYRSVISPDNHDKGL